MDTDPQLSALASTGLDALVWRFSTPVRSISSATLGGGIGARHWIINAQVASDYSRIDPEAHLQDIASELECRDGGVGLLTAAAVSRFVRHCDGKVVAYATVGIQHPAFAAAPTAMTDSSAATIGTINVVAFVPVRLADAALVNAVLTATEAKTQALLEAGVAGTGTASDAICVITPIDGAAAAFAGPRSEAGSALARAVHGAVAEGTRGWFASRKGPQ